MKHIKYVRVYNVQTQTLYNFTTNYYYIAQNHRYWCLIKFQENLKSWYVMSIWTWDCLIILQLLQDWSSNFQWFLKSLEGLFLFRWHVDLENKEMGECKILKILSYVFKPRTLWKLTFPTYLSPWLKWSGEAGAFALTDHH